MLDEGVIVEASDEGRDSPPTAFRPILVRAGLVAFVLAAAVIALSLFDSLFGLDSAAPSDSAELEAPRVAGAPPSTGEPARPQLPEIALGWTRLDLPGEGTVIGLAHGDTGWMALAGGEQSSVATSPDGRVWVTRSFPGSLDGEVRCLVAGSRLVVVDSAVRDGGGARSWISSDGGITWDTALFPNGFARVESINAPGERLFAGGAIATGAGDLLEEGGPTTAAVWEYSEGVWNPIAFAEPPGRYSGVDALVVESGGVLAFGRADGGPAAWRLAGSSLVPEPIAIPRQAEGGTFSAVTRSTEGWWLAEFKTRSAVSYALSNDLRTWDLLGMGYDGSRSTSVSATRLGIVHVGDDDQFFRVVDHSEILEVSYRYQDTVTGFEPGRHTAVVASDGDLIVMGGGSYSPAIWVRGLMGGRVGVTARPASGDGRWRLEKAFGPGFIAEGPQPFQVVRSGGGLVIATPQGVWRTSESLTGRPDRDEVSADHLIPTSRGLLMIDSASRLFRDEGGGRWIPENLPITVGGVTETTSSVVAYGWNDQGQLVIASRPDGGEWEVVPPDPSSPIHPVAAAGGLLLGFDAGRSPQDGGRVSADGVTWSPIEIGGLRGLESGIPFLVTETTSDSTTIELLDDRRSLTVPTIDPVEAVRVGEMVRVRGPDGLWETADGGASWISFPIGIEYRLTGPIRLIPTEQPRVLMAARDSYRIYEFER